MTVQFISNCNMSLKEWWASRNCQSDLRARITLFNQPDSRLHSVQKIFSVEWILSSRDNISQAGWWLCMYFFLNIVFYMFLYDWMISPKRRSKSFNKCVPSWSYLTSLCTSTSFVKWTWWYFPLYRGLRGLIM